MTHRMAFLNDTGHSLVEWETETENEDSSVALAEREAKKYQDLGYALFTGDQQIEKFDPHASEILALPPLAGG